MSFHESLNLLKELRKRDEMQGFAKQFIVCCFAMSLINSIIQEHKY